MLTSYKKWEESHPNFLATARPAFGRFFVSSISFEGDRSLRSLQGWVRRSVGRNLEVEVRGSHPSQKTRRMGHPLCFWLPAKSGGRKQPYANTARDAPPVAVSRVGCCELSWHVHSSQRNSSVRVTPCPCRQTCTATTALDTPTLLRQVVISAVPFSEHLALAIFSSKLWSRFASVINL